MQKLTTLIKLFLIYIWNKGNNVYPTLLGSYRSIFPFSGFTDALRAATSGQAFPQCLFDHWQVVPGDPWDPETKAGSLVRDVRLRKGLNPVVPAPDYYIDRL